MPRKKSKRPKRHISQPSASNEPALYPVGMKFFELKFTYGYDLAIPDVHPLGIRLPKENDYNIANVRVKRVNGSITIDDARVSAKSKNLTRSSKRLPKNTPYIMVDLAETQPLQYRVHEVSKVIAPTFRSQITIHFVGKETTLGDVISKGKKFFNQLLRGYRNASGDPVPYVHEDKKELGIVLVKFTPIKQVVALELKDIKNLVPFLGTAKAIYDGGISAGINTPDYDMVAKPYVKDLVIKTVEYGLLPEKMPLHNDTIIEAIELAHRKNEYGLGIVLLNLAFEAAMTFSFLACLTLLDNSEADVKKLFKDQYRDLEDKRVHFDELREKVLDKFSLPHVKKFRGSAEESRWDKSTYKKRHTVIHVTDTTDGTITIADFTKALEDTQKVIALLDLPFDAIKVAKNRQ